MIPLSYLFSDEWGTFYDLDRILLPLEGFPGEIEALNVALYLAECSGALLKLFHILKQPAEKERSFDRLREMAIGKARSMETKLEVEIGQGDAVEGILTRAQDHDLIVVGGRRKLRENIFGSVSSGVIRHTPKPVVVVTSPIAGWEDEEKPIRKLLIPLGDMEEDVAAVKLAAALTSSATMKDFQLLALHVVTLPITTPISAYSEDVEEERRFLKEVGELTKQIARPITPRVVVGRSVGRSVVGFAEEHGSDIILLGERKKPGPFTRLLGTEALYISRNAPCPVVLVYKP
ncbi:MAG: universal stress protein [Candidatus Geothermarchaeales archaeon]